MSQWKSLLVLLYNMPDAIQCARLQSKLKYVRCKSEEQKNVSFIQKNYLRNFWKTSSKLLEETVESSNIQPICSAEEAHSFSEEYIYSAQQHIFSQNGCP